MSSEPSELHDKEKSMQFDDFSPEEITAILQILHKFGTNDSNEYKCIPWNDVKNEGLQYRQRFENDDFLDAESHDSKNTDESNAPGNLLIISWLKIDDKVEYFPFIFTKKNGRPYRYFIKISNSQLPDSASLPWPGDFSVLNFKIDEDRSFKQDPSLINTCYALFYGIYYIFKLTEHKHKRQNKSGIIPTIEAIILRSLLKKNKITDNEFKKNPLFYSNDFRIIYPLLRLTLLLKPDQSKALTYDTIIEEIGPINKSNKLSISIFQFVEIYFARLRIAEASHSKATLDIEEKFQHWYAKALIMLTLKRGEIHESQPDEEIFTKLLTNLKSIFYFQRKPEAMQLCLQEIIHTKDKLLSLSRKREGRKEDDGSEPISDKAIAQQIEYKQDYQDFIWSIEKLRWKNVEKDVMPMGRKSTLFDTLKQIIINFLKNVFPDLDEDSKSTVRNDVLENWIKDAKRDLFDYRESWWVAQDRAEESRKLLAKLNPSDVNVPGMPYYYEAVTTAGINATESDQTIMKDRTMGKCSFLIWNFETRNITGSRFQKALYKIKRQFIIHFFIMLNPDEQKEIIEQDIRAIKHKLNMSDDEAKGDEQDTVKSKLKQFEDLLDDLAQQGKHSSFHESEMKLYKIMDEQSKCIQKEHTHEEARTETPSSHADRSVSSASTPRP